MLHSEVGASHRVGAGFRKRCSFESVSWFWELQKDPKQNTDVQIKSNETLVFIVVKMNYINVEETLQILYRAQFSLFIFEFFRFKLTSNKCINYGLP